MRPNSSTSLQPEPHHDSQTHPLADSFGFRRAAKRCERLLALSRLRWIWCLWLRLGLQSGDELCSLAAVLCNLSASLLLPADHGPALWREPVRLVARNGANHIYRRAGNAGESGATDHR